MAKVDQVLVSLPEDNPPQSKDIKLFPFWTSYPFASFTLVELLLSFAAGTMTRANLTTFFWPCQPAELVSQIMDVVYTLPGIDQYKYFKNHLLEIHLLSDYEKFDMLIQMILL